MKYHVKGEMDMKKNSEITITIIELVCNTKKEAKKVLEDRTGTYKNLEIIEVPSELE